MGGSHSSKRADTKGLDDAIKQAQDRLGSIAVSGRYHRPPKTLTHDYNVDEKSVLGSGYNGAVYKATSKEGGKPYAVKDFKLQGVAKDKMTELEGECEIFLSMDHPHICRLVDAYQMDEKLSLVMECCEGGELFDRVLERKHYSEKDAADATYQMLLALNYLHGRKICHRDIKLENFLYEKKDTDHLKLIDFGFSKVWDVNQKMKMSCGTLSYVAPEVLAKSYTIACDMWSLGVVVFILCLGYMPFSGDESRQMRDIKSGAFSKKESWRNMEKQRPSCCDFISKLICVDTAKRLTAEKALEHDFIVKRSSLSQSAAKAEVDVETVNSLCAFAEASKFRRACLSCMAWSLTNEERTELRAAFLAMDKSNTGSITLKEFKDCIEARFDFTDEKVNSIFNSLDTSSNHEIHYSEFLAAMVSTRVKVHDDLLKATFRRFDTDSTGFIEISDLQQILGETFEGEALDSLIKEADTNGDGKISYEEFLEFAKEEHAHDHKITEVANKIVDKELEKKSFSAGGFFPLGSMRKKIGLPAGTV